MKYFPSRTYTPWPLRGALWALLLASLCAPAAADPPRASRVRVGAGCFPMGGVPGGFCMEHPAHAVCVDGFQIDATEVTNQAYGRCILAGACQPPGGQPNGRPPRPNEPVTMVTWDDAQRYCAYAGGRLPTEAEREYSARGAVGRAYPWGDDEPECTDANYGAWPYWGWNCAGQYWCSHAKRCRHHNPGAVEAVGARRRDVTPSGIHDLAGNVAEWVADYFDPTYYDHSPVQNPAGPRGGTARAVRGGSWNYTHWSVRLTSRQSMPQAQRLASIGFRCVYPGGGKAPGAVPEPVLMAVRARRGTDRSCSATPGPLAANR